MSMQPALPLTRPTATPGPWVINKRFNGHVITRRWSSGFYQRASTGWLKTLGRAEAALTALNGVTA